MMCLLEMIVYDYNKRIRYGIGKEEGGEGGCYVRHS